MNISFWGLTFYGFVAGGLYLAIYWLFSQCIGNIQLFIAVLALVSAITGITFEVERAIKEEREYRNGRP